MRKILATLVALASLATMSVASGAAKDRSSFHSLTIGDIAVNEASGIASFVLQISPPPDVSEGEFFRITATTLERTATSGSDYVSRTQRIEWPPGSAVATRRFDVSLLGDTFVEPAEAFDVVLSDPASGCTVSRCPAPVLQFDELAVATIHDAVPLSHLSVGDVRGATKDADCVVPVTLTPPTTITVTVRWQAGSAGVIGGVLSGDLVFPPGASVRNAIVDVQRRPRHAKTIPFLLSGADGATIEDAEGSCRVDHRRTRRR